MRCQPGTLPGTPSTGSKWIRLDPICFGEASSFNESMEKTPPFHYEMSNFICWKPPCFCWELMPFCRNVSDFFVGKKSCIQLCSLKCRIFVWKKNTKNHGSFEVSRPFSS